MHPISSSLHTALHAREYDSGAQTRHTRIGYARVSGWTFCTTRLDAGKRMYFHSSRHDTLKEDSVSLLFFSDRIDGGWEAPTGTVV
jgi:hypothetical protein